MILVHTPPARLSLLALLLALVTGFATTACTGSEESVPATTEAAVAVDAPPGADAPCTADALTLAGSVRAGSKPRHRGQLGL